MSSVVYNQGDNSDRGPSKAIWSDFDAIDVIRNPSKGILFWDDFLDFGLPGTQTTQINNGRYKLYATTAGVFAPDIMPHGTLTGDLQGVISFNPDSDGDNGAITTNAAPFSLSTTAGAAGRLFFEARIATTSVSGTPGLIFVGLGEGNAMTLATGVPFGAGAGTTGTGVSNTGALIGFNRLESGGTALNFSHSDRAQVFTNVQASAGTMAAETWIKVGFVFDPNNTTACIQPYVNGVKTTTPMTKATLAALTHVDAKGLSPIFAAVCKTTTTNYHYLDWWRVGQLTPNK